MTEGNDRRATPEPFEQHELYAQAMERQAAGDGDGTVERLRRLAQIYPEEEQLRELLLRTEFQAAVASTAAVPAERRAPAPVLRILLVSLLITAIGMAMLAALIAAFNYFSGRVEASEQEQRITSLLQEVEDRLDTDDWIGAQETIELYRALVPNDTRIEEWHRRIEEGLEVSNRYVDALEVQDAERWAEAYTLFTALQQDHPDYRPDQVAQHIEECEEQLALEATWRDAESAVDAQDWPKALELLRWLRTYNPGYHTQEVKQRLYEINKLLGLQGIEQAGGDVARLEQALAYLDEALQIESTDWPLIEERKWAGKYRDGAKAFAGQDWVGAIWYWEPVYLARPAYGDGRLRERLRELYPQAARQLISQVAGRPATPEPGPAETDQPQQPVEVEVDQPLELALVYLERAVADWPDDEGLKTERDQLIAYLDGKDAFIKEYWDLAIAYWGPVYEQRPDYLGGTLREDLTVACASSDDPDPAYCPPR